MASFYRTRQFTLAVCALLGFGWLAYQMETADDPFHSYPAPSFTLKSESGEELSYPGKKGPMLIVFVSSQTTPENLDLDVKALKFAQENQASCWLIGERGLPNQLRGLDFVTRGLDPKGTVVEKFPSQGGPIEWVVIDLEGTVRWSGLRSGMELKAKLTDGF